MYRCITRAESDLRLRAQRTDDADRVRDMQNAYNHARQAAREHQQSSDAEMAHLKLQLKKARWGGVQVESSLPIA